MTDGKQYGPYYSKRTQATQKSTDYKQSIFMKLITIFSSSGFHPKDLFFEAKKNNVSLTVKEVADWATARSILPLQKSYHMK